ncbi:hypothetical protein L360_04939 [Enterobacter sp. MGH 14]|nr:hypothetical protein L360_04939 [Enterobacter sp. MGH 14]
MAADFLTDKQTHRTTGVIAAEPNEIQLHGIFHLDERGPYFHQPA